jgi:transposase
MSLSSKFKVPMPETGIITRRSGTYQYVYKVLKSYRDVKGRPNNDRVSIGRRDTESGMLIPNNNYWKFYDSNTVELLPSYDSVRSIGATFLIQKILETTGSKAILNNVFGSERAAMIGTIAAYMVCRGNVMEHILDWCESSTLNEPVTDDRQASVLSASIAYDERMEFFRQWTAIHTEDSYLAYDVTSFSSYAKGIQDTEWGYNRDGDYLPQINLGCYLGYESRLPLFYVTYPGSIVDKSHMRYMMANNDELGIKGATFVMDKGFCSTTNIRYMHSCRLPYLIGVEARHKATRAAIDSVRTNLLSMEKRISQGVYADCVRGFFYGEQASMHIYFDPVLAEGHRSDLYRTVEVQEEKLKQLQQLTKQEAKRYRTFFDIDLAEDGTFNFERSYVRIDEAARNSGFFCLLTSTGLSGAEVLDIYRRKDVIEKSFDELKNHIEMKRLRTHNTHTTDGKLFCAFMALIVVSQMNHTLESLIKEKSLSKNTIITEMEKVKVVFTVGGKRLMNPITKTQRLILEAFALGEEDIKIYIAS